MKVNYEIIDGFYNTPSANISMKFDNLEDAIDCFTNRLLMYVNSRSLREEDFYRFISKILPAWVSEDIDPKTGSFRTIKLEPCVFSYHYITIKAYEVVDVDKLQVEVNNFTNRVINLVKNSVLAR